MLPLAPGFVVDATVGAYVALDVISFLLAGVVALFFWRTSRILPGTGHAVLALAFAVLGATFLSVAVTEFELVPDSPALEAARVGGQFLGVVLVFANYASRQLRLPARTLQVAAASAVVVGIVYLVLYLVVPPFGSLPEPLAYRPWIRLVGFALLAASSYLVATGVHGRRLADYQVPVGFLLLAMSKYTTGILGLYGVAGDEPWTYFWRLAGLLVLLRVVWPSKGWPRAEA